MSSIAIRELVRAGVESVRHSVSTAGSPGTALTEETESILTRLTQLGTILVDHDKIDLWQECVSGLLEIFRLGMPKNTGLGAVDVESSEYLFRIVQRVFVLGAYATRSKQFSLGRILVLQEPDERHRQNYWVRYAVTMISRGHLPQWRKSLIAPSSEYVRAHAEFFGLFDENMDLVVNAMCQFDMFQCVVVTHETSDATRCYPNFGGYWNHRTVPVVRDMIQGGPSRQALGEISDSRLADILVALDQMAARNFFDVNGWDAGVWEDPAIVEFISKHAGAK